MQSLQPVDLDETATHLHPLAAAQHARPEPLALTSLEPMAAALVAAAAAPAQPETAVLAVLAVSELGVVVVALRSAEAVRGLAEMEAMANAS